jgi:hypothetical protein
MKERFLKEIREKLDEGVFGGQNFIQEIKERFKIKSLRSRGGSRKEEK